MSTVCSGCGGTEFDLEGGSRICIECGGHQVDFVELEEQEQGWETEKSFFYYLGKKLGNNASFQEIERGSMGWSTFEAYNIILKEWTETLVKQGASKKFKEAVFNLWVLYLQKRKIAFIKKDASENKVENCDKEKPEQIKKENLEFMTRRDLKILKGFKFEKKKKTGKSSAQLSELDSVKAKVSSKKGRLSLGNSLRGATPFLAKEMNRTLNSTTLDFSNVDASDEEVSVDTPLDLSSYEGVNATNILMDIANEDMDFPNIVEDTKDKPPQKEETPQGPVVNPSKRFIALGTEENCIYGWMYFSPVHLNLQKLLSIVYLALLMAEEEILLLDLLRWCCEGHLPFQSAGYLLEKEKRLQSSDYMLFNSSVPSANEIRIHAAAMATLMSVQMVPLPSFNTCIDKIAKALNLPDDLKILILNVLDVLSMDHHSFISIPAVESLTAAAVVLVFKAVFGMDGEHEELLSQWADKLNIIFRIEKQKYRVFSWRKWQRYINRMNWCTDEMNMSINPCDKTKKSVDASRFMQYYWTQGMWKAPIAGNCNKTDTWSSEMLTHLLSLQGKTLQEVLSEKQLFNKYSHPNTGLLEQYIKEGYKRDQGKNKERLLKIGQELLETNFSSHRFNWLFCKHEIVSLFSSFGKEVHIQKVSLTSPTDLYKRMEKLSGSQKSRKRKRSSETADELHSTPANAKITSNTEKEQSSQPQNNGFPISLFIPDPLKSYWVIGELLYKDFETLPSSFQWLVNILSKLCQTTPRDIFHRFMMIETKYVRICTKK